MKTLDVLTACALAVSVVLSGASATARGKPPPVDAAACPTPGDGTELCYTELNDLCFAIDGATSLKGRDRDTMVSKVNGARLKIDEGKYDDASGKLYEIELKLDSLVNAAKPKVSEYDADFITAELIDARSCVDALP